MFISISERYTKKESSRRVTHLKKKKKELKQKPGINGFAGVTQNEEMFLPLSP